MHNIKFQRISLEQGLSQSVVYCILQDRRGFMWFGTQYGINRYDGNKFSVYKNESSNESSIPNNYIFSSYKDKDSQLWFGTLNGYLIKYDSSNDCFMNSKIITSEYEKSSDILITSICEDAHDNLWIGSEGSDIIKYNKKRRTFESFKGLYGEAGISGNENISSLFCDGENLWIGTWDQGLNVYNLNSRKYRRFRNNPLDMFSISSDRINFIFKDSRKIMWIGTKKGLNKFDAEEEKFYPYFHNPENKNSISENNLTCMCEDDNGILWIGSRNNGLNSLNTEEDKFINYRFDKNDPGSLGNDAVISLYKDSSNVIWAGTYGGGVNKLDREAKKFSILDLTKKFNNPNVNNVNCIIEDSDSTLWVGTHSEGLFQIVKGADEIKNYKSNQNLSGITGKSIMALCEDQNSNIWIGTHNGGLTCYNKNTKEFENYFYNSDKTEENKIWSIYYDNSGYDDILLIGTSDCGLLQFDLKNKKFSVYLDKNNQMLFSKSIIKTIAKDSLQNIWIGTSNIGLFRISPDKNLKQFVFDKDNPDGIGDNSIISIYEDKNKNLWIGTYSGGLNKFDRMNEHFTKITTHDGLPNNIVTAIIEDEECNLWLGTNNGLSKFNPMQKTFKNYFGSDGLQSNEFNHGAYFKSRGGIFYFGGINGITFFDPKEIKENTFMPNIVISDFQIFNHSIKNSPDNPFLKKSVTETEEIILSYRESVFSFEFAALIYNNPEKNRFAYMMEGFDKEWNYCGARRSATYTNLDPGEYVFRVKGSNNDSIWNDDGTSVKIVITPPFWKKWWFKSLGVMSVTGGLVAAYRQKLSKIKKEKSSQEEFSRRLLDSQEEERKRISVELHHTIAHDILITKNKAVIGLKKSDNIEDAKKVLNEISDLASETLNDVRTISHNLHPHQIERLGLTKALKSILNTASKSTSIEFSDFVQNIDNVFSKELEINIFRIIQECITNIIKHSEATKAALTIIRDKKTIVITIWDNGIGISKERRNGLGLESLAERIKLYKGELVIESVQSKGTLIEISLPIKKL